MNARIAIALATLGTLGTLGVACEAPDRVTSSGNQEVPVETGPDVPQPPAAVVVRVGPRTIQRVSLEGLPDADPPIVLGHPIIAAAASPSGELAATMRRDDGRFVLERRGTTATGARSVTPLDRIHGDGPTAVFAQSSGGAVLGTASEVRYVESGDAGVALGVHRLPHPRALTVLAEVDREFWAFDDSSAPHLVHRFAAGDRSLPRYLASSPLPVGGALQAIAIGPERLLVLGTAPEGGRTLTELDPTCIRDTDSAPASCITHRVRDASAAAESALRHVALDGDAVWFAAGERGLLRAAWPPAEAGDEALLAVETFDFGRPVWDVFAWGPRALVVVGEPDAVAWLERDEDGAPSLGPETPLSGRGAFLRAGSLPE